LYFFLFFIYSRVFKSCFFIPLFFKENAKRPARCSNPSSNSTDAPKKYVGLLQVSSSQQVSESGAALKENAKRIYDTIPLGNNECDNGVLIFYLKDKQQVSLFN
jgi:hypothetical protein